MAFVMLLVSVLAFQMVLGWVLVKALGLALRLVTAMLRHRLDR